ncbi:MAG: septal ring lytic transglycosylase RlpA family protein [Burkholderiaceae bacterium]|jgi:rare lipoprotein A|nr:septal ring lytic transglycosylase RlpA family protein [Burkholderiaceae bacterium]
MKLINIFILTLLTFLLVACGGSPSVKTSEPTKPTEVSKAKKSGGYYLDDGPGDNPPANIDAIPDAVPRVETLLVRANKPYVALGNSYTPMTEYQPYKKRGVASWYGKRYHGQKTSAGEVYDMYGMTGAHTVLPLPSYVRVTNPENQKSVIIRINDRGPFHSDRLIDLSYAASYKLGLAGKGSGIVDVEAIDPRKFVQNAPPASAPKAMPPTEASSVIVEPLKTANIPAPTVIESTSSSTSPSTQGKLTPPPVSGAFVQVGAFKSAENAELLSRKITGQNLVENTPVNSWYNQGIHRVRIGPYANRSEAELAAAKVKKALGLNTYIVD